MRGSALLLLLLFVSAIALMVTGLCSQTIGMVQYLGYVRARESALSAVESALARTRFVLSLYDDWRTNPPSNLFTNEQFDGCTYTVVLSGRRRDEVTADIIANSEGSSVRMRARIRRVTDWWNFDWNLRRPVTITNTTSAQTDYQVRVVVPRCPEMQSDFDDLRFTTSTGVLLSHWLEAYDSTQAIVWVKVPSIPANGSTTIYIYYGNPSASSASSIANTMESTYIKNVLSTANWVTRTATSPVQQGDDVGVWVNFSFTFPYWRDYNKTRAYACSNGFLIFDPTAATNDASNTLAEMVARCMVAPFWDDLRTDNIGNPICPNPGLYVDSYSDRIMFDWEATYVNVSLRQIKFQAILYRNGDIAVNIDGSRNITQFTPTLGISLGNGTNYIDITGERPTTDKNYGVANKSWLFTIRKYVNPEPTTTIGDVEYAQKTIVVLRERY